MPSEGKYVGTRCNWSEAFFIQINSQRKFLKCKKSYLNLIHKATQYLAALPQASFWVTTAVHTQPTKYQCKFEATAQKLLDHENSKIIRYLCENVSENYVGTYHWGIIGCDNENVRNGGCDNCTK